MDVFTDVEVVIDMNRLSIYTKSICHTDVLVIWRDRPFLWTEWVANGFLINGVQRYHWKSDNNAVVKAADIWQELVNGFFNVTTNMKRSTISIISICASVTRDPWYSNPTVSKRTCLKYMCIYDILAYYTTAFQLYLEQTRHTSFNNGQSWCVIRGQMYILWIKGQSFLSTWH
jgi:hypothetical protein